MATTLKDLKDWFNEGKKQKATHMIVVCDTFAYEDYPVYVARGEDVHAKIAHYNGPNMQKIMEVYNLSKTWEQQNRNLQSGGRVYDI